MTALLPHSLWGFPQTPGLAALEVTSTTYCPSTPERSETGGLGGTPSNTTKGAVIVTDWFPIECWEVALQVARPEAEQATWFSVYVCITISAA